MKLDTGMEYILHYTIKVSMALVLKNCKQLLHHEPQSSKEVNLYLPPISLKSFINVRENIDTNT